MCSKDVDGHAYGKVTGLSRFSIFVSFICASCYCAAFVGSGWVHTKEPYRLTNLNLYTSVTFNIGLWKACHSFKRINSTISKYVQKFIALEFLLFYSSSSYSFSVSTFLCYLCSQVFASLFLSLSLPLPLSLLQRKSNRWFCFVQLWYFYLNKSKLF